MIEYAPIIAFAIFAIALVIGIIACRRELEKFRPRQRVEGTEQDYQRLCQELAVSVSSEAEYESVQARVSELIEQDHQSENTDSGASRLTQQEVRYLHGLQNAAWTYAESHPWVQVDAIEKAGCLAQVELIEQTVAQATALVEQKNLKYREAKILLDSASHCAKHTRNLLTGQVETDMPQLLVSQLRELDDTVARGYRDAKKALILYLAEDAGQIRYEVNVGTLIIRASYTDDTDEAESLLRQAVRQANDPDTDETVTDLGRAKTALGLILWYHQDKKEEALTLLRSAARNYVWEDHPEEVFDLLGEIASLSKSLEDNNAANQYLNLQAELLEKCKPGAYSMAIRNLEARALLYENCEWFDRAEKAHRSALQTAENRHDDFETRNCLKAFAFFLGRQSRFKEATKLLDRHRKLESRFSNNLEFLRPDELSFMANCFEQCNRQEEASYYCAKASMAQRRREQFQAEQAEVTARENVLFYRTTSWHVRDGL